MDKSNMHNFLCCGLRIFNINSPSNQRPFKFEYIKKQIYEPFAHN